jgi:hypothetical protein
LRSCSYGGNEQIKGAENVKNHFPHPKTLKLPPKFSLNGEVSEKREWEMNVGFCFSLPPQENLKFSTNQFKSFSRDTKYSQNHKDLQKFNNIRRNRKK